MLQCDRACRKMRAEFVASAKVTISVVNLLKRVSRKQRLDLRTSNLQMYHLSKWHNVHDNSFSNVKAILHDVILKRDQRYNFHRLIFDPKILTWVKIFKMC